MDLHTLEPQLINKIIMMSRPTYRYLKEIEFLSVWYDDETVFANENKIRWMFDAIKLRRETQDIAGNYPLKTRHSFWN